MSASNIIHFGARIIRKNTPIILTGIGVAGVLSTAVLAVKATPKALEVLEKYHNEQKELTKFEIIKLTWRFYIPSATIGLLTCACIIGAHRVHVRRNLALASLYSLTEAGFREYERKVEEVLGTRKEQKIRDEINRDKIYLNPSSTNEVIVTGLGDVLCYDALTGRYFKSNIEMIRRIINNANQELLSSGYITLNELYSDLGLPATNLGGYTGWNIDKGLIEPKFSSHLNPDNIPCLVLDFRVQPMEYLMNG